MDPCFFRKNHTRRLTTVMSFCTAVELLTRVARLVCVISAMSWPSVVTFRRMRLTTNKSLRCADSVFYCWSLVAFSLYPWVRMLGRCCSCVGLLRLCVFHMVYSALFRISTSFVCAVRTEAANTAPSAVLQLYVLGVVACSPTFCVASARLYLEAADIICLPCDEETAMIF